ncbi:Thioredoxin [Candidatus Electronema halotolerans]|jgi:thioredoxin 1
MASEKVIQATDKTFDSLTNGEIPCLVDFWAPWCGPCKAIGPVIEQLAEEFDGQANIVKVNVDDNQETAGRFNVRAIPTLIMFKKGEVKGQITGAVGKGQLVELINKAL